MSMPFAHTISTPTRTLQKQLQRFTSPSSRRPVPSSIAMSDSAATLLAETIQSASINHHPDPKHDSNPSTAASYKIPVRFRSHLHRRKSSSPSSSPPARSDEVPISILEPTPRSNALPPLPDLRFEQSYLAKIKNCTSWQSVAWTTFLDHVIMPFGQGIVWNLAVFGWRAWNQETKFAGAGVGARVRRWWWDVNGWRVPGLSALGKSAGVRRGVDAEVLAEKTAQQAEEFWIAQFGSAGQD